ncbi:hypothetical protein [Alkalicoccus chagannorensis]|uniref:hypothetical protein n=1 Tax=Alkalicoccus chagannorensis TaxID=427072 RepID=UPI0003FEA4C9|nr:hypothetical protein [Alkalicoccus chagannorensis]
MKSIELRNGKLYTEAKIQQGDSFETLQVVIDTSRERTVLNSRFIQEKQLEAVSIGPLRVSSFHVLLDDMDEAGIIGLDFLVKTGAKINLDAMAISSSRT